MKCIDCGGEVTVYEGVEVCIDCTLFWPAEDDEGDDELVTADEASNKAGEGCGPAGDGE